VTAEEGKRLAAERACDLVQAGMRVGLGTGSTAALFVAGTRPARHADRRRSDVGGDASQAAALGIRLATLEDEPELDLTVDGADEIDPALNLVKGGGGALLREKLVAAASRRMVVIADSSKQVRQLGRFALPVEVVPFGLETTRRRIASCLRELELSTEIRVRLGGDGRPFTTDGGNRILDLPLGEIPDPHGLAASLKAVLGVVEHGLFVGMAASALIGGPEGVIEVAGQ
jgi:ribose 5-phosphate isomerase A